ncbi:MAG: hypothetical protein ABEJ81_02590 [Haloferacaceae archaeon]
MSLSGLSFALVSPRMSVIVELSVPADTFELGHLMAVQPEGQVRLE